MSNKLHWKETEAQRNHRAAIAEMRPLPPTPAPEPDPNAFDAEGFASLFEPAHEDIDTHCKYSGLERLAARGELKREAASRAAVLRPLVKGGEIEDLRARMEAAHRELHAAGSELVKLFECRNEAERLLMLRATARRRLAADKAELDGARATLDSPESLKLSGGRLAKLGAQVKHLPTLVAITETEIAGLDKQIADFFSGSCLDAKALVAQIFEGTRPGDDVRRMIEAGQLSAE